MSRCGSGSKARQPWTSPTESRGVGRRGPFGGIRSLRLSPRFGCRIAKTAQAELSNLEAAQIYVRVATSRKDAGRPEAEWRDLVLKASAALDEVGPGHENEAARLRGVIEELRRPTAPAAPDPM